MMFVTILTAVSVCLYCMSALYTAALQIERVDKTKTGRVVAHLASGKRVVGDALLYTMGRQVSNKHKRITVIQYCQYC
jgi:hypothetical protein